MNFEKTVRTEGGVESALRETDSSEQTRSILRQAQKMAALSVIAGGVAHDVNNPLNGIINYAELLREEWGAAPAEARQYADMIVQETHRTARIVRTFFHFLRMDDGEQNPASVKDLATGAEALASALLRHSGIDFRVEVADDLPAVLCNEQAVSQVLVNLLLNACQAVNDRFQQANGEKRICLRAERVDRGETPYISLAVEDNGIGMDEQVRSQATTPFYTTRSSTDSMGLGLAVAQEIVEEHKGILELESTPGKGTVARVLLPVDM